MIVLFREGTGPWSEATPERVVAGAPAMRWRVFEEASGGRLSAGEWEAGIGAWSVRYTEWEFCHVTRGRARLIPDDSGAAIEVTAGDSFIVRPGFTGVWDVTEPMTKHFVVIDPPLEGDSQ